MRHSIAFIAVVLLSTPAAAQQNQGQSLHDRHCRSCHGTEVYTREDRFIDSMAGLKSRVSFCARNAAEVSWDQAQIDAVAGYLSDAFYDF